MLPDVYRQFQKKIKHIVPEKNIITDPLWTLVYGTDAGFYRLIPKIVVNVTVEAEVIGCLQEANRLKLPVTFRAAGTSLSGQSISDSILIRLGRGWKNYEIINNAEKIRLEPGIIGSQANHWLAKYGRKIGPDPASIDTAKIGGILGNNASGMCCGVAQNSYQTIDSMKVVLVDGTVLDTANETSKQEFANSHGFILEQLSDLRNQVIADNTLADRIRHKFKIKNTTGYSLNALVDFEDPFQILQHLLIGSEGTLAFISEVVYRTVVEHQHKASALIFYPDMKTACQTIPILKKQAVAAAEIIDRAGLRSVESKEGMPDYLKTLDSQVTAVLVETRAGNHKSLHQQIDQITQSLSDFKTVQPIEFTDKVDEYTVYWNIRKGLFPAVGAIRETGTTVIIEDVAFPIENLSEAALELQSLFKKYRYGEAIIFGHALEGNLHFVFTQDFSTDDEVKRYKAFIDELVELVVDRFDGSLKAEHGTGRNMAPFVEKEWGITAYKLMKSIKQLFDPNNLLNPGVIINDDVEVHLKNLKPMPATNTIVDKCIECGFCEPICPSKDLTFSPRQRIVGRREISRQIAAHGKSDLIKRLQAAYQYPGNDTCATDSLCGTRCPVGIDTGKLTKYLRQENNSGFSEKVADWIGSHFELTTGIINKSLSLVDRVHRMTGDSFLPKSSSLVRSLSGKKLPQWNSELPSGVSKISQKPINQNNPLKVVYFPSCASRSMSGPTKKASHTDDLPSRTFSLLKKAGYEVILPDNLSGLCCGQAFESKGFIDLADRKREELTEMLLEQSQDGKLPILFDTSPCLGRMIQDTDDRLKFFEPIEFVLKFLHERLIFEPIDSKIALHLTCSSRKMGLEKKLIELARKCAKEVVIPEDIYCCGFAGDRGLNFPELNASALADLSQQVTDCDAGYSTSVTCEIGLSLHGGIPYRSILYLVDEASRKL